MTSFRSILSLLFLSLASFCVNAAVLDGTAAVKSSPEEDYTYMVQMSSDMSFHWNGFAGGNTLDACIIHTGSYASRASWMMFGASAKDASATSDFLTGSNVVIGILSPFSIKKYDLSSESVAAASLSSHQTIMSAGFFQRINADKSFSTVVTFKEPARASNPEDVAILTSGVNVFVWAVGPSADTSSGLSQQVSDGVFTLDFSAVGVVSSGGTPAPVTPAPTPQPATLAPVGSDPNTLEDEWLAAHNVRREALYLSKSVTIVNLKWSQSLAYSAQRYAEYLGSLDGCTIKHESHVTEYGENLAAAGNGDSGFRDPVEPLKQWYEGEQHDPFGSNGHYTQVAWRPSKYVGCGQVVKPYVIDTFDGYCHIEVCRYMAKGNCNTDASNWEEKMLADTSPCPSQCPEEGCF